MKAPEPAEQTATGARGLDGLMFRYSRWKRRSLVDLAEAPLSTLAFRSLYLCGCILLDGVILPWAVTVLGGGFSFPLFALLIVPAVAAEAVVYRRTKTAAAKPA